METKTALKTHFCQLCIIENGVLKVLVVLKVTKGLVKVFHGYSEVDFGNPDPPITNIPHWGDTQRDPHGRATELRDIGDSLSRFYATGVAENTCDGPCDEDDIL